MNNGRVLITRPVNEPVKEYLPNSAERIALEAELKRQSSEEIEIPLIINGKEVRTGNLGKVVMPHDHKHVLAHYHKTTEKEVTMAIDSALKAKKEWERMPWDERANIIARIAETLSKRHRARLNAATMLGQSKNAYQAEIDSACEAIDFMRFNNFYAKDIYENQPASGPNQLNRMEYRPLEGFVFTITPFNFTAIASNLNLSPVLFGNVTLWKPSTTALLSNYHMMKVYQEAGLPDGVINFVPGQGSILSKVALSRREFSGIHFTGSTGTFNTLWKTVGENLTKYISYPKLVGETGGKDFIFVHASANPLEVATAIVKGSFEFQGQKCSAASRSYVPKSLWAEVKKYILDMTSIIKMGDVRDFDNYVNAVIDEASFDNIKGYIDRAKNSNECEIITGGKCDKSIGYFVEPTVIVTTNPRYESMCEEIFGPVMTIFVYDDKDFESTLELCDQTSPYALTGALFAYDSKALLLASEKLKYAAGNFYINDKPTGAVVGMQPFGGSRNSGTNDKAGGMLNLIRWTNPRAIKETFNPDRDFKYSYMSK